MSAIYAASAIPGTQTGTSARPPAVPSGSLLLRARFGFVSPLHGPRTSPAAAPAPAPARSAPLRPPEMDTGAGAGAGRSPSCRTKPPAAPGICRRRMRAGRSAAEWEPNAPVAGPASVRAWGRAFEATSSRLSSINPCLSQSIWGNGDYTLNK